MKKILLAFTIFLTAFLSANAQCLVFPACPFSPQDVCDVSANDPLFWNESYWHDPVINSANVPEGPADLCLTVVDTCGLGNMEILYKLYLDLDQDGTRETVVRSDDLPGYNVVYFGNAGNPNNTGGTARAFDERPVPQNQKYGFALQAGVSGDSLTACVRWATQENPSAYAIPQLPYGTHKIEWTVTQNGEEKICAYLFNVKDCKKPTVACINGLSVNIIPTQIVALWNTDFLQYAEDNVTPTDQIQIGIRKSGTGNGFPLNPDGTPQTFVTFFCPNDLGTQYVELWSIDKAGNAGFCETYVIVQDQMGICGSPNTGPGICVKTACGDVPLEEYVVDITGGSPALPPIGIFTPPVPPDTNGCISITIGPFGSNYLAMPVKDNDHLNGVSTFDLVLINKHILGLQPLDAPYKMLAADANNSKSLTTFDIVELRKLILGIYTELPNNTSWRFYPADHVFSLPNPFTTPIPNSDTLSEFPAFKAVKVGDVNCSAIASSAQAPPEDRGLAALDLPDIILAAGQTIELPLRVASGADWLGFQFALETDPDALEIERILPGILPNLDENTFAQTRPGLLTVSWFSAAAQHLPAGATLLTLKVRARKATVLSDAVRLVSQRIAPEAYTAEERIQSLQLFFAPAVSGETQVLAPRPNPTSGAVSIPIRTVQPGAVELTVSDLSGREVFRQVFQMEAGLQEMLVPAAAMPQGGVYVWRVMAGDVVHSGKLVRH